MEFGKPLPHDFPDTPSDEFIKTEQATQFNFEIWRDRTQHIIDTVLKIEADSIGIEPTIQALTDFNLSILKSSYKTPEFLLFAHLPGWENPFLQKILYEARDIIAASTSDDDLLTHIKPVLPRLKTLQREVVSKDVLLHAHNVQRQLGKKPSIALSTQPRGRVIAAQERGYFPGRIGFSGDGVNELMHGMDKELVMVTPFQNLQKVGPVAARSEPGALAEDEWSLFTGVPVDAIEVILPGVLFQRRISSNILDMLERKNATPEQREIFLKKYQHWRLPYIPPEYAKSLKYTFETTGKLLTAQQNEQLQSRNYTNDSFWDAGLKPLREFE